MIEKFYYSGDDFKPLVGLKTWRVAFLRFSERFSKFDMLERHTETDEVFVLLEGEATLYTDAETVRMEKCAIYNIPCGEWHHITVSTDATVLVIENSNTSAENTEKLKMEAIN